MQAILLLEPLLLIPLQVYRVTVALDWPCSIAGSEGSTPASGMDVVCCTVKTKTTARIIKTKETSTKKVQTEKIRVSEKNSLGEHGYLFLAFVVLCR